MNEAFRLAEEFKRKIKELENQKITKKIISSLIEDIDYIMSTAYSSEY